MSKEDVQMKDSFPSERGVRMNHIEWTEIVEFVRSQDNGVMRVDLCFDHDGDNVCAFGRPASAYARSSRSMQEAVERCYYEWYLNNRSQIATNSGWEEFTKSLGLEKP